MRRAALLVAVLLALVATATATATARTDGLHSAAWTLVRASPGGHTLTVRFATAPACGWTFVRPSVRERPRHVTVAILERHRPLAPGEACAQVLLSRTARVHLRRPLGRRRLVHAQTEPGAPR